MNSLYPSAASLLLTGGVDYLSADWHVLAVDDTFVFAHADQWLADVDAGVRLGDSAITGRSLAATPSGDSAVGAAPDLLITTDAGLTFGALVLYVDSGSEATSPLIAFLDLSADGPPVSGETVADGLVVQWDARGVLRVGTA